MATTIPASQARAQFTSDCIAVFTDMIGPTSFLRSFFPSEQSFTRYLSIQVERNLELVAVDVLRGTDGNRNNFSKSTEKVIDPPYYKEYFDLTQIDLYDRLFGSTAIDAGMYSQLLQTVARRLNALRNKIERAYEIQAASILETGTVTLVNATSIDFGRKSGSLVANAAGNTWATSTVSPFANLADGCQFLREVGKCEGETFNAILGKEAFRALFANDIFKARVIQNLNNNIDTIMQPQRQAIGQTYHGTLSCDSYRVNLFTYAQSYDLNGTATPYLNSKKVTVIPENPGFKTGFAAVPQLIKIGNGMPEDSELQPLNAQNYVVYESIDADNDAHKLGIKSAGILIPIAIDRMYTFQPVA